MGTRKYWVLAIISGLVWAAIAWVIGGRDSGGGFVGGVMASPLIGLAVAGATREWSTLPRIARAGAALVALYAAASAFGLAMGLFDWLSGPRASRIAIGVILQAPLGVLWGITFTGYVFLLWPLAYLNLRLLTWPEQ